MKQVLLSIIFLFLLSCSCEKKCKVIFRRASDNFPCVPTKFSKDSLDEVNGGRKINVTFMATNQTNEKLYCRFDIDAVCRGKKTRLHRFEYVSRSMYPNDTVYMDFTFERDNFRELGLDEGTISPVDLIKALSFEQHKDTSTVAPSGKVVADLEISTYEYFHILTNRCDLMHCD